MFKKISWITLFFVSPVWSYSDKKLDESSKALIANIQIQQEKLDYLLNIRVKKDTPGAKQVVSKAPKRRSDLEKQIEKFKVKIEKRLGSRRLRSIQASS